MEIRVSDLYENLIFKLNLEDRVTIIGGDSGTGKSTFLRYIKNKDSMKTKIDSPLKLLVTNKDNLIGILNISGNNYLNENYIYIIEDEDGADSEEISKFICKSSNRFIIISRDIAGYYEYYKSGKIYEFKSDGKYNILIKSKNLKYGLIEENCNAKYLFWQ